jgi:hypothetical protein
MSGTGGSITQHKPGFRPKLVRLYNVGGLVEAVWMEGMADGSAWLTIDSGAGATDKSLITTGGVTPGGQGFVLGTNADINAAGEQIRYEVHG